MNNRTVGSNRRRFAPQMNLGVVQEDDQGGLPIQGQPARKSIGKIGSFW
jgi:hypothetical protein